MEKIASSPQAQIQNIVVMNQVQDQDWKEEHIKLIERNKKKFWQVILRFLLDLHNYDPFYLFKVEDEQLRGNLFREAKADMLEEGGNAKKFDTRQQVRKLHLNSLYASSELKMRQSKWDRPRERFNLLIRIFLSYFFTKAVLICIVQHSLLKYQYLVPKDNRKPLLSLEACRWFAETVGNPLYTLKDTSLLLYGAPPAFTIMCAAILPAYYKRKPMNMAPLRFILNPYHELRRIDVSIRNKMATMRSSFAIYKQEQRQRHQLGHAFSLAASSDFIEPGQHQQVKTLSGDPAPSNGGLFALRSHSKANEKAHKQDWRRPKEKPSSFMMIERSAALVQALHEQRLGELERREEAYYLWLNRQLDELSSKSEQRVSRPITLEPDYFIKISTKMQPTVWGLCALYSFFFAVLGSSVLYSLYSDRCKTANCNPLDAFGASETLMLFEVLFCLVFNILSAIQNTVSFSLLTNNQLDLIYSVKAELLNCRKTIMDYNERCRVTIAKCGGGGGGGDDDLDLDLRLDDDERGETSCASAALERRELERFLLRSLFRLMICDEELGDNSRAIALETVHSFFYAFACISLAVVNSQFKFPDTSFMGSFILGSSWFTFNSIAITCAHVHSRVLEIGRIPWSILAAKAPVFHECYRPVEGSRRAARAAQAAWARDGEDCHWKGHRQLAEQLVDDDTRANRHQLKGQLHQAAMARQHQRRLRRRCCTFVSDMWTRFVYSTSTNAERHCSRLFNVELNYQSIIEMNFFAVLVYSLTMLDK